MATDILDKFAASTALTITLASLATSSDSKTGRQSDIVDNTTVRYRDILIYVKVKQGTSPTGSKGVVVYGIRSDAHATPHRTDGAGASDAAITVLNARAIGVGGNKASPATGEEIFIDCIFHRPGPKWAIAIAHNTAVALEATPGNHWARYVGLNPEAQ